MRFVDTDHCNSYRSWDADNPAYRPGRWIKDAEEKVLSAIRKKVNAYKATICSEAVYEMAEKRYNPQSASGYSTMAFLVLPNRRQIYVPNCISIPDVPNEIKVSDLDDEAGGLVDLYTEIEQLKSDFDHGTESEQKKIFSLIFSDDDEKFASICAEVMG